MMEVFNRICDLRRQHAFTQTEMAHKMNISHSVFNRIENGTRPIRDEELKSIAHIFNVTTDYLLGNDEKAATTLPKDESALLSKFRTLTADSKQLVLSLVDKLQGAAV